MTREWKLVVVGLCVVVGILCLFEINDTLSWMTQWRVNEIQMQINGQLTDILESNRFANQSVDQIARTLDEIFSDVGKWREVTTERKRAE